MENFTCYLNTEEKTTYWICDDCKPKKETDEVIDRIYDEFGSILCEICGKEFNHDTMEYLLF